MSIGVSRTQILEGPKNVAGGDLSGTYPNPTVVKVNGASVPASDNFVGTNASSQIVAAPYTPENTANKDAASGYAGLDANTFLKVAEQQETVDARTTTSEAVSNTDRGKIVTFSNTSAVAATIAQAGASSLFLAGWWADLANINTGIVTLTPTTSTINGNSTLVLVKGEGGRLISDGTNYIFIAGQPTTDTPADANILTYIAADGRWEAKAISTLGGANASQIRGENISAAVGSAGASQNYAPLTWVNANSDFELVPPAQNPYLIGIAYAIASGFALA